MPEGDAVRRTARRLDEALSGATLTRGELRVPRLATADLRGAVVQATAVVGKHLLTRMDLAGRAVTLHSHLRLDGSWRVGPPGPARAPAHQVRAWLASPTGQVVGLRVHDLDLAPTEQEHRWVGRLGPDILGEQFDVEAVVDRLARADRPLVTALLDQELVSGLGTMWASELAWSAGADPRQPTGSVRRLAPALREVRARMQRAVVSPEGRGRLAVFERTGQPCRRCGAPVLSTRVGTTPRDRPTYWCPRCQPGDGTMGR